MLGFADAATALKAPFRIYCLARLIDMNLGPTND